MPYCGVLLVHATCEEIVLKLDALQRSSLARRTLSGEIVKLNVEQRSVQLTGLPSLQTTIFQVPGVSVHRPR